MTKEKAKRLTPTKDTLNRLFALSGNQCAFPGCSHPLFFEGTFVAQVCHIEGAMPGGQRFNKRKTNDSRRQHENLIAFCYLHHKITDNTDKYPPTVLFQYKTEHEAQFSGAPPYVVPDALLDQIYAELRSIKTDTSETLKFVKEQNQAILDTHKNTKKILSLLEEGESNSDASNIDAEITSILSLRNSNRSQSALDLLLKMKSERWEQLTDKERYRVYANIGICYLDLRDEKNAALQFISCIDYNRNDDKALSFAALGYAIQGDLVKARKFVSKALNVNQHSTNAYVALVLTSEKEAAFQELVNMIPVEIRQTSEVAYALAQAAHARGDKESEITWKQIALEATERLKADLKASLATAILQSIENPFAIVTGQIDIETTNKVRYALTLLNEAWDELKGTEKSIPFSDILLNRGVAKKMLKEMDGAFEDINEAARLSADYFSLRHLAAIAFETGKDEKALETILALEHLADEEQKKEVVLFKAQMFYKMGRLTEAHDLLISLQGGNLKPDLTKLTEHILINILIETGQIETALNRCQTAISIQPDNLLPYLKSAEIYSSQNNNELALKSLLQGYEQVSVKSDQADIHDLAIWFYQYKDYAKAAELFEKITDPSVYSDLTKKLLRAYYEAGESKKVLELCEQLETLYGPIDFLTELKSLIYEQILDITNAVITCKEYLVTYPDDQFILIRLALIYARANDTENLKTILAGIRKIDSTLSYSRRFQVAQLFCSVGLTNEGLQIAYETRRAFYGIGKVHLIYFNLSSEINKLAEKLSTIYTVGVDNVAILQMETGSIVPYIIEDRQDARRDLNEIELSSNLAQTLIGKQVGDTIEFESTLQPTKAVIVEVLHKYAYAQRESIDLLSSRHIDTEGLQVFNSGTSGDIRKDLKPLFDKLDAGELSDIAISELYNEGGLTIGSIASHKKTNPIKTWGVHLSQEIFGIYTIGTPKEYEIGKRKINDNEGLLFDLLSLITLAALDQLPLLDNISNPKAIAQATLEEILDLIRELERTPADAFMRIGKVNSRYVKETITPEQTQQQLTHYRQLVEWIRTNMEILPCTAALSMNAVEKAKMDEVIGRSFYDSILTAKEKDYLLVAEENGLRSIAALDYNVPGFSLFLFYNFLFHEKKAIQKEEFDNLVLNLIRFNYKNVPVESVILYKAASLSKFSVSHPLSTAIQSLSINYFTEERTIKIVSDFFYLLYADSGIVTYATNSMHSVRTNIVLATLAKLVINRDPESIKQKLLQRLPIKFRLLQPQLDELMSTVISFFQARLIS